MDEERERKLAQAVERVLVQGDKPLTEDQWAALGFSPWDAAEHIRDEEEGRLFMEACEEISGGDAAFMARARETVARAAALSPTQPQESK